MRIKKWIVVILLLPVYWFITSEALLSAPQENDKTKKIEIGGAFLGILNYLYESNRLPDSPRRQQFDFAGNIDFLWKVSHKVRVFLQVQGGSGGGTLGFAGSTPGITDLNVEIDLGPNSQITLGSFVTPFGADSSYLTFNGDTLQNPLILNTLFYSAFSGSNVNRLNTLGIKGYWQNKFGEFSLAVTNGTDDAAVNGDGNFEMVFFTRTAPMFRSIVLGASYIKSKDRSLSGTSGTHSDFRGWLVDMIGEFGDRFCLKAYYGQLHYGDDDPSSDDRVDVWKLEGRCGFKKFYIAARMSGWEPMPGNPLIPNPGYAIDTGEGPVYNGEKIRRYQAGFGWMFHRDMVIKTEMFYDDYYDSHLTASENIDTYGVIIVCNIMLK